MQQPERPEIRTFSIEQLIELVKRGKLRPTWRSFRWRSDQVLALFESVRDGLPVGSLVLRKCQADAGRVFVGSFSTEVLATAEALEILDGQQRTSALLGAMLHPAPAPRADLGAVWFDLESTAFFFPQGIPSPTSIPVNVLADATRLLRWLSSFHLGSERPDLVERALQISRSLREYTLPAYLVETSSREVLGTLLRRLHGPEREHEAFNMALGTQRPGPVDEACYRLLQETEFGFLPPERFWRTTRVIFGLLHPGVAPEEPSLLGAIEPAYRALLSVFEFLSKDAGIAHLWLLPTMDPIPVVAALFHLFPDPRPRTIELLSRWLWRGLLGRPLDSGNTEAPESLLRHMNPDDEGEAVKWLLLRGWYTDDTISTSTTQQFIPHPAVLVLEDRRYLLGINAMLHARPLALPSGEPIDFQAIRAKCNAGERFLWPVSPGEVLASLILSSQEPPAEAIFSSSPETLASQFIFPDAASALQRGDWTTFARLRGDAMAVFFQKYFRKKTGVGDGDRPAISSLLRRVDASLSEEP